VLFFTPPGGALKNIALEHMDGGGSVFPYFPHHFAG